MVVIPLALVALVVVAMVVKTTPMAAASTTALGWEGGGAGLRGWSEDGTSPRATFRRRGGTATGGDYPPEPSTLTPAVELTRP